MLDLHVLVYKSIAVVILNLSCSSSRKARRI
jgi:hypothetical protein